jgi:hypothetical protein
MQRMGGNPSTLKNVSLLNGGGKTKKTRARKARPSFLLECNPHKVRHTCNAWVAILH